MNCRRQILLISIAIGGGTLSACATSGPHLGAPTDVVIAEYGSSDMPAPDYCQQFRPTSRQVAHFFNSARILSGYEHNELYSHGPCFARGTAKFGGSEAQWKMVLGGTGTIIFNEDFIVLVADPASEEPIEQ